MFLTRNMRVLEARLVGRDQSHLKMRVGRDRDVVEAIAFGQGHMIGETRGSVDLVYTAGTDHWGGRPRLQLMVLDLRASGASNLASGR